MSEDPRASRHSRFVSKLGHELRTPLGSVLMMAELLAENGPGNLTEKQLAYARRIHRAASEMRALLDETSTLAKIEGGRLELYPQELALAELGRHVEETHGVRVELAADAPASVVTDRSRLERIVAALVASAGAVAVAVRIASSGREGMAAAIAVGCGAPIPEDRRQAIFEPFSQADPRTRRRQGSGQSLELPIARRLARLLGGDLVVEDAEGGCAFVLHLP